VNEHRGIVLHPQEWLMLAEERALIDLMRAILNTTPRERSVCQHGHVHAEMYEPDMLFVPININ